MIEVTEKIFRDNEPELVLLSYSENHTGTFQLLDCDGYPLGRIVCEEIYVLCVTTQWESFGELEVIPVKELPVSGDFSWLKEIAPDDYLLVLLTPVFDDEKQQESALPIIAKERRGYIVCKSISFAPEKSLAT